MKTAFSMTLAGRCLGLLALVLGLTTAQAQVPPPAGPVTYQTFYDALSPYGQWVNDPDYGYMWVPTAGADFQPYRTAGHWVYTDYGWTWVSDYAWGWAPFHYGRWRFADGYGWVWVPGYSWGPAWVAWRQNAGYYGWAPLGPPPVRGGVHVSIGLSFSFGDAPVVPARWCFVPAAYVASPRLATYYVPPANTTVVYNQTTVIRNTYINKQVNNTTIINNNGDRRGGGGFPAGPARADVEHATGRPLQQLSVTNRATPGVGVQGRSLAFYRPSVAAPGPGGPRGSAGPAPAPRRVVPLPEAARQSRAAQPATGSDGLQRGKAAQQLNSTDAHPFRDAQVAASQPSAAGATPGQPAQFRRGGRLANIQGTDQPPTSVASPAATSAPDQQTRQQQQQQRQQANLAQQPAADQTAQQQLREQRQQQRLQNQQARQQQQGQQDQQLRQQQQAQRQQNQLARQQQQQARQQQAQARQQQAQEQRQIRQQERPQPRGDGGERRR